MPLLLHIIVAGNAAHKNRRAENNIGGNESKPISITTKLKPQINAINTAIQTSVIFIYTTLLFRLSTVAMGLSSWENTILFLYVFRDLCYKLFIHHKGIHKAKLSMPESFWQGSDYFEPVPFPEPNCDLIRRDNQVVLHCPKASRNCLML